MSNNYNMARLGSQTNIIDADAETAFSVITGNQIITDDYTTEASKNSLMIGPITVQDGKSLTIGTNGNLTIV
jgi:hypothetical protein